MAGNVDYPRIWLGADVYVAPVGTTAPTDVTTAWAAAWKALGLLSEDGMTSGRQQEETEHYAWGQIVRITRRRHKRQFVVTALEDNDTVYKLVNPNSTSGTAMGTTTRVVKTPTPDPRAFGFELVDGANKRRIIIPRGEVTNVADVPMSDSEMTRYELTITVYPNSSGEFYTEITNDAANAVS